MWHCDREGGYSLYTEGVADENYLRGVQETDDRGRVTFTSVFPGCYPGRWPHIHFEVYGSLADATTATAITSTSQLALPKDVCDAVYATEGYESSVDNLGRLSLESDSVFRDGHDQQLAVVKGSVAEVHRRADHRGVNRHRWPDRGCDLLPTGSIIVATCWYVN